MELGTKTRPLLVSLFGTLVLLGGNLLGNHPEAFCNRTSLYLLAQYKMAVGDTTSGVELMSLAAGMKNAAASHQEPEAAQNCSADNRVEAMSPSRT